MWDTKLSVVYLSFSHQVFVGEARELLLYAEIHQSIGREGGEVIQHFLLLLQVAPHQFDLRVKSLQLVVVLSRLSL